MAVGRAAAPARADAARHPGDRPRGVPHRPRRVEGRDLPDSARVGRVLRSRARGGDGRGSSATRCGSSASIRGSRPCSTSSATRAGDASTSASPRTPTSSARSAPPTCGGCRMPASTPRSSTSSATRPRRPGAITRRCTSGRRELADVLLPPFEMAIRDGGARSVMNSYAEIDGVPVATSEELLTGILRERWGFDGVVVSDYFSVAFLHTMHAVAEDLGDAAALALAAGIDVELPTGDAFTAPLAAAVRDGRVDEALVDRAVLRVLAEKEELGLLDETFERPPPRSTSTRPLIARSPVASPRSRSCCSRTTGILPLDARRARAHRGHRPERRLARGAHGLLLLRQPRAGAPPRGAARASRSRALSTRCARSCRMPSIEVAAGCDVTGDDASGIADGRRGGPRGRRRRRRRRRSSRTVRTRHRRRRQRRRGPGAARASSGGSWKRS